MGTKKYNQGLRRSDGSDREENDYYATHPSAIPPLLKLMGWEKGGLLIRENSCGAGLLSMMLEVYGHKVISTDLINRGYGIAPVNFLEPNFYDNLPYDATVMNPPYKHSVAFIKKSLEQSPIVCAFLRLTFLESQRRVDFFKKYPPKIVAVFSERMKSSKNAKWVNKKGKEEKGTATYAWFIFERGFQGEPVIKWI